MDDISQELIDVTKLLQKVPIREPYHQNGKQALLSPSSGEYLEISLKTTLM